MDCTFFHAASRPGDFPVADLPEVAFLGRSNVGKSSLLNSLAGTKKLAFTSSTPGRTRGLNFFRVDGKVTFVDLPGYGYAKVSKDERASWQKLIESYLLDRKPLELSILLVDVRRGWMEADLELKTWLEFHQRPYLVVATKVDKLKSRNELNRALEAIRKVYSGGAPVAFSAVTGQGVREIWQTILTTTKRP
jgi:GTP-binding protein